MRQSEPQRWQRRKADRPAEILDAALGLFAEKGYAATRLEEVARRAGVSKGTLYLYFESKEALFKAVVTTLVVPELERAEHTIETARGNARDLLAQLLRGWWQSVGESRLCGLPKLIIAEAGNFPELARFYSDEVISRARRVIAAVIEQGIRQGEFKACDSELTARLVLAPLIFAAIWKQSLAPWDQPGLDMERYLDQHVDLILHGLQATPGTGNHRND